MDYKDYYAALGVDRKATSAEIQKAYRKLARKLHPDVNKTPEAEARFKEITEAYEVLKNDDKRAKYDQFGSAWKQAQSSGGGPPPGFEDLFAAFGGQGGRSRGGFQGTGGSGFSSFFEALFGGGGGGQSASWNWQDLGAQAAAPATDHEAAMTLSLEDAARGGERELTLTDPATGKARRLRVKIPAGVRSGQRIRLGGQGGKSHSGGKAGDLYLKIDLLPHPRFKLDGDRLITDLEITPSEAALGTEAQVQTLNGRVKVRIPAGSSSGRKIRLRGKGYPSSSGAGDLIARIRVVVPGELSDDERALYEKLSEVSSFRPRGDGPLN